MVLPDGYKRHRGKKCPVDANALVDCIVRTGVGLAHSGISKASLHDWNPADHKDGIGAVVGYREMKRGQQVDPVELGHVWPENMKRV